MRKTNSPIAGSTVIKSLLRRLAIHEQEISEAAPDEKLEWLLKQNLFWQILRT